MKNAEKHISKLLVAAALFLVFGNVAFAGESLQNSDTSVTIFSVKEQGHDKPYFLNDLSSGEVSQTVSQNKYLGLDFVRGLVSNQNLSLTNVASNYTCFYSSKDKRELIFQYLFPFHFFW